MQERIASVRGEIEKTEGVILCQCTYFIFAKKKPGLPVLSKPAGMWVGTKALIGMATLF